MPTIDESPARRPDLRRHRAPRAVGIVFAAVVIVLLGVNVHYRAAPGKKKQRSDFVMLYAAGQAVLEGQDIYAVRHPRGWPFYYPPATAALMAPFALIPYSASIVAWYGFSVVALVKGMLRLRIGNPLSLL